jgi:hydrophobic/amphiphilic exporter-1 (mainly G- bacteria), HAE1 family
LVRIYHRIIDDAIVVRENIFRHMEMGKSAIAAAIEGTKEVSMAVIATTLTILAVFGPIAFLQGMVGQFFKEFGMTICFAIIISLFDALTIAPMMSAYFAGKPHHGPKKKGIAYYTVGWIITGFDKLQTTMENGYVWALKHTVKRPILIIFLALLIFAGSIVAVKHVSKTFLPAQDNGEFVVSLEMNPGTTLDRMDTVAQQIDQLLRDMTTVSSTVLSVGNADGAANASEIFVTLVPSKQRVGQNTSQIKDVVRTALKPYAYANPVVKDGDSTGGGARPFNLNIKGQDLTKLETISHEVMAYLKTHPALKDVDVSLKSGKPKFQILVDAQKAGKLGISPVNLGQELRTLVEGSTPGVYRENGEEYDIRVRLKPEQRDLSARFDSISIPNVNQTMIRLSDVAIPTRSVGPTSITRQDRSRYVLIAADLAADGPGVGGAMTDVKQYFIEHPLPEGMSYSFSGQAESFQELGMNMMIAAILGILFIYLVLASLYESFVSPLTIMLVLPLAACGAFYALWITDKSLDIFSMIGCIMLLGGIDQEQYFVGRLYSTARQRWL